MKSLKMIIALGVFATSSVVMAQGCVDEKGNDILSQPAVFQALIAKAGSCYEASELARACAWGSSMDLHTAGAAYDVCFAQMKKNQPTKKDTDLLVAMSDACSVRYDKEDGTMYRSAAAYCQLSAIEFVTNLVTKDEVY